MDYRMIEQHNQKCVECYASESLIQAERDALDLVAACMEYDTNLLMIHAQALSEDFFKLKTGVAGKVLQKFINYRIKTAILIPDDIKLSGKFKELLAEANKGNEYRAFTSKQEAAQWLFK